MHGAMNFKLPDDVVSSIYRQVRWRRWRHFQVLSDTCYTGLDWQRAESHAAYTASHLSHLFSPLIQNIFTFNREQKTLTAI